MNQLNVHCGCCGKPVAVVDDKGDLNVLHGTLKECSKCGGQCIQNNQVILRDPAMDIITVVKVTPKPAVEEPATPWVREVEKTVGKFSAETVPQGAHSDKPARKPDIPTASKQSKHESKKKSKSSGFFKRKN